MSSVLTAAEISAFRAAAEDRDPYSFEMRAVCDSHEALRAYADALRAVVGAAACMAECTDHVAASCAEWCRACQEEVRSGDVFKAALVPPRPRMGVEYVRRGKPLILNARCNVCAVLVGVPIACASYEQMPRCPRAKCKGTLYVCCW